MSDVYRALLWGVGAAFAAAVLVGVFLLGRLTGLDDQRRG